jgi:ribosomal protein L29
MGRTVTTPELRKMPREDLKREILLQEAKALALRFGVSLGKEKDTARYRRERKQLARMLTILHEKKMEKRLSLGAKPR